jgi:catechol 2,3-dioxygenase-like lactoylglutathione lyase family enzyme
LVNKRRQLVEQAGEWRVVSGGAEMNVHSVLETCLYVDDLLKAERFYCDVLGLKLESRQEGRHVFFHCGRQMLLLFNPLACREPNEQFPQHGAFGPGHVAFGVRESELPAWTERLKRHGVEIEKIIDWPGGGRSLYFRDPSGNSVELATPKIWGIPEESIAPLTTDH